MSETENQTSCRHSIEQWNMRYSNIQRSAFSMIYSPFFLLLSIVNRINNRDSCDRQVHGQFSMVEYPSTTTTTVADDDYSTSND